MSYFDAQAASCSRSFADIRAGPRTQKGRPSPFLLAGKRAGATPISLSGTGPLYRIPSRRATYPPILNTFRKENSLVATSFLPTHTPLLAARRPARHPLLRLVLHPRTGRADAR